MAPRLKVFVTSDGLTDYVVATTSKAKALAAWGIRQDVFKEGLARETDDPGMVEAAQAQPGEVLRRPAETRAELAKLKPARKPKAMAEAPPRRPAGPSKAALRKVADLQAKLAELDAEHAAAAGDLESEKAELERRQAELSRRADALQTEHAARREKLQAQLSAARAALE